MWTVEIEEMVKASSESSFYVVVRDVVSAHVDALADAVDGECLRG